MHYFAIAIVIGVSYTFIDKTAHFFLGGEKKREDITIESVTFYVSVFPLVAAMFIFILAHWPPGGADIS